MRGSAPRTEVWVRRVFSALPWRRGPVPLGARGEAFAAAFLKKKGFRIIARNRRRNKGEIDLIALDRHFVVFVEVRTRASESVMSPEDSIRHDKRQTVIQTVRRLMRKHRAAGLIPRIDVVAIIWPVDAREPTVVRHHPAAMPL